MDFENGLKNGFDVWKNNAASFIVGCIVIFLPFVITIAATALVSYIAATLLGSFLLAFGVSLISIVILFLVAFFVVIPLSFGLVHMAIKGAQGDKVEIKDVFYSFTSLHGYIRSLIFAFIVLLPFVILTLISLIPLIGFFVLPLYPIIAFIAVFFLIFALYICIMVPSKNITYAVSESSNIAMENPLITLLLIVICLILNLIGTLLLFVGLFATVPITLVLTAFVLMELKPDIKDQQFICQI